MKKFTLVFSFLMLGLLAFGQDEYLLADFEGNGGVTDFGSWSYIYWQDVLVNPVTDGINTSDSAMYFPAHNFESSWGPAYSGEFNFKGYDPVAHQEYLYLRFKMLILQDSVQEGQKVKNTIKFRGSGDGEEWVPDPIITELTPGGGNEWVEHLVMLPAALSGVSIDKEIVVTCQNMCGDDPCAIGENEIDVYFDDFAYADEESSTVGIEPLSYTNGMAAYMAYDQLMIRMEASTTVDAIQVFDIKGSMLINKAMNISGTVFNLPVDLNSGVYLVRIKTDKQVLTKKFIK